MGRLYTAEDEKVVEKEFCHEGWDAGYKLEYAVRSQPAVLLLRALLSAEAKYC